MLRQATYNQFKTYIISFSSATCVSPSLQRVFASTLAPTHSDSRSSTPWYALKEEEIVYAPTSSGDETGYVFEFRHASQKFGAVLSHLRSTFPPPVWNHITRLYPDRRKTNPLCVDIAVAAEGRAGVELARRGFHVIGVESNPFMLARTFQFAESHNAENIELVTAKVERSLLPDSSADLVTFFHGLHLVSNEVCALQEVHRMLKPTGKFIAAWNDRDLSDKFIQKLENIMERHIPTYNRHQKQRNIQHWRDRLQIGNRFHLIEYTVHPNHIPMLSASSLMDVLDCMSFVRYNLSGQARKKFNDDVRALLLSCFGSKRFTLPLETKLFILEKVEEGKIQKKR